MTQHTLILGIFDSNEALKEAVRRLLDTAFSSKDVSLLLNDRQVTERLVRDLGIVPPATAAAALSNLGPLGPFAVLAGLAAMVPGIGAALTSSPIETEMQGGDFRSQPDVIVRALVAVGVADREARDYAARIHHGNGLLVVRCITPDQCVKADSVLRKNGAESISSLEIH